MSVEQLREIGRRCRLAYCRYTLIFFSCAEEYFADLLVAGTVIVELKAVKRLLPEHEAQLLNYLKATPYEVGLLLNFGPKPEIKRKAFDNSRKGSMRWLAGS